MLKRITHYIKVMHTEEQTANVLNETLSPLAQAITEGQTSLMEY